MIQSLLIKLSVVLLLSFIVHDINIISIGYENMKALKAATNNLTIQIQNFLNSISFTK